MKLLRKIGYIGLNSGGCWPFIALESLSGKVQTELIVWARFLSETPSWALSSRISVELNWIKSGVLSNPWASLLTNWRRKRNTVEFVSFRFLHAALESPRKESEAGALTKKTSNSSVLS